MYEMKNLPPPMAVLNKLKTAAYDVSERYVA